LLRFIGSLGTAKRELPLLFSLTELLELLCAHLIN